MFIQLYQNSDPLENKVYKIGGLVMAQSVAKSRQGIFFDGAS